MYSLIVDYSGFALNCNAYVVDPQNQVIHAESLSRDDILAFAFGNTNWKIHNIKLSGPKEYCYGLKEQLEFKLASEYSINYINVEVID